MNWVKLDEQKPDAEGYYYTRYLHKNGNTYRKALWWNGNIFSYKDLVEVYAYTPERFDYYVPCMMKGEGLE